MITTRGLILLLTNRDDNWAYRSLESAHEVVTVTDLPQAVKMLNNIRCDLLILDDNTLVQQTSNVVRELKRKFPHFPIAILVDRLDDSYHEGLVSAGADLLLTPSHSLKEMQRQMHLILQQNVQRRALVAHSQKLYIISSLPLMLRNLSDTREILFQAIKIVINLLDLEAVMAVINDGYGYHAYTGTKPLSIADPLAENTIFEDQNNPILWSIRHRMTLVYNDVYLNHCFTVPEGLDKHSVAIIVPFAYPGSDCGAIVFFITQKMPVVNEDISVYERFVAQVDSILLRAHQNQLQGRHLSLNKRLIDGWATFANTYSFDEVIRQLCMTVSSISAVKNLLILYLDPQTMTELVLDDCDGKLISTLDTTDSRRIIDNFQSKLSGDSQTAVIDIQEVDNPEAKHLLMQFGADRFILMPIMVSDEKIGNMIISINENHRLDALDLHLLENIMQIAINALQRITLSNIVLRNHLELMSIICSITEGVFYVNENQKVTFYNPQFTELTSVPMANWINQDVDALLSAIAKMSQSPVQTLNQLQSAMQRLSVNDHEQDYPIVTVLLNERNIELRIEFVRIDNNSEKASWLGIIHPIQPAQGSMMLERLLERVRISHTQMHSAINTLAEQHGHFGYNERNELLSQIRIDTANAGKRWNQFSVLYKLYFGGMSLLREPVNLNDLLERVLKDIRLAGASTLNKIRLPSRTAVINVDEFHFARALSDLFVRLVQVTPSEAQLEIKVEIQVRQVNIVVTSSSLESLGEIEEILENSPYQSASTEETLDLYIATELIRRNGAKITIQPLGHEAKVLSILIPIVPLLAQQTANNESAELVDELDAAVVIQNSTPSREPNSIMIVEGHSKLIRRLNTQLTNEGFSILHYNTGEDAVLDVAATYLDLIVIDLHLNEKNAFDICKRVRKRTETPILVIADTATDQEKVQSLQEGADDIISSPITDDELLARVRVIINRRYIAARTSEPILFGDLYIDFARRAVFWENKPIELTRIEYDILSVLIVNRGQTVTHKQLLTQVWGPEYQDESQYLWVNISRLRKKLEPTQESPRYVRTQPGVGYYFAAPGF